MKISIMKNLFRSLLLIGVVNVVNAECLDKLLPDFNNGNISIEGTKNTYALNGTNSKLICKVTPKELEHYVNKNFIKYSADKTIVQSWNYLAVNKQVVYDYLKDLRSDDRDFDSFTSYKLFGVVNGQFACYQVNYDGYTVGAAHPNHGVTYTCDYPSPTNQEGSNKYVDINNVISQSDLVSAILKSPDIIGILQKVGVKPSTIKTKTQLYTALVKDDDMACVLGDSIPTQFAITKVNKDGTINLIYSLGSNAAHVCQAATPDDIVIKNVKSKIIINSFITPQELQPRLVK